MPDGFTKQWVKNNAGIDLNPFQEKCFLILCRAYGCGVYDLPVSWAALERKNRCTKDFDRPWYFAVNIGQRNGLATFDSPGLTMLVIAAHEECIRVSINAVAPRLYHIKMHKRNSREGAMHERHPTIERAIETYRKRYGEPHA